MSLTQVEVANQTLIQPYRLKTLAEITYEPDEVKYRKRTAARLAADPTLPSRPIPKGFPQRMTDCVLYFDETTFKDENEWTYKLSEAELLEIKNAVKFFSAKQVPFGFIDKITFPLPTLGPVLAEKVAPELYSGRGFTVISGIPVDEYSYNENIIIHAGLSAYIGNKRGRQHPDGSQVVSHVVDLTTKFAPNSIGTNQYTANRQCFHTDFGEMVSLYGLQSAAIGGTSHFASVAKIYNVLAETRPDLLEVMASDWAFDLVAKDGSYSMRPLLYFHEGKLLFQYTRRIFAGYGAFQRSEEIPVLTEAQAEVMDAIEFLGREHSVSLDLKKGDIQFVNSVSILHSRDAFQDTPTHKRDALRMWMRSEELLPTVPAQWNSHWNKMYYVLKPEEEEFALDESCKFLTKSQLVGGEWTV